MNELPFWIRVKVQLNKMKKTQKWLSAETDISFPTLQGWISKNRLPTSNNAVKIANALKTTVEYLVTGDNQESDPLILQVQKSPATRRIVEMLLPLPENVIEAVRHGIAGILTSLGYKPGEKDEKGEPGSMVG